MGPNVRLRCAGFGVLNAFRLLPEVNNTLHEYKIYG